MNTIRNKFNELSTLIKYKVSILTIAETKLDESFTSNQFLLENYKKPYRLDKSKTSGGLLVYILQDIPSKLLRNFSFPEDFQALPFEITLKKQKWLIISVYNPDKNTGKLFLENLSLLLDFYLRSYDSYVIIGDMNLEPDKNPMKQFIEDYNLFNLIKKPTCFKSTKGTCIDLILTNKKFSFQFSDTYETGLSDCHTLIYTMFKSTFYKLKPKKIIYRNYKMFNEEAFLKEIVYTLSNTKNVCNYENFEMCLLSILNKHAPLKQKIIRGNDKPFISKTAQKEIFERSKLKNKYNKTGLESDWANFKKQRNFVSALIKKEKKTFFANIAVEPGDKKFWKTCKPYLNNKIDFTNDKINLFDDGKLVSEEAKVAHIFNTYFANILCTLNITHWKGIPPLVNDPSIVYQKYINHPSILKIKESQKQSNLFDFKNVEPKDVLGVINKLKKGNGELPIHILKILKDTCSIFLTDCINTSINNCEFPSTLKWAEIIPIFKNKGESSNKENYRPISILPTISKVFEKIMFDQINNYMQNKFSKLLCGFRKGFSTQVALTRLLTKWQQSLDKKEVVGTVLIDLSKAYDCIQHSLLLAKLEAYGFSKKALKFLHSYLRGRKQKV